MKRSTPPVWFVVFAVVILPLMVYAAWYETRPVHSCSVVDIIDRDGIRFGVGLFAPQTPDVRKVVVRCSLASDVSVKVERDVSVDAKTLRRVEIGMPWDWERGRPVAEAKR